MRVILTGVAGFIGYHVATRLLEQGNEVVGIDNLNDYYSVALKRARLKRLSQYKGFAFHELDISDKEAMFALFEKNSDARNVIHLAAQAGVRYSLINPFAYIQSNLMGHTVVLEASRRLDDPQNIVYASSSSVYGGNTKMPFSVDDPVEKPVSLYAATKRSNELISYSYAHMYGLPQTGLRFFTVYGPWGRPDMAAFIFAEGISQGRSITVFNKGEMWRDFTYIDDILDGVLAAAAHPPKGTPPHRVFNLGNHRSEKLIDMVNLLEDLLGKKAIIEFQDMPKGDVPKTYADIDLSRTELGFEPRTSLREGLLKFVEWFATHRGLY